MSVSFIFPIDYVNVLLQAISVEEWSSYGWETMWIWYSRFYIENIKACKATKGREVKVL